MLGEVTCDNCGKTYLKENRLINENRRLGSKNYCSMDCHRQGKTTAITKNCAHCGQEVNRRLAEYAKSQSGHVFCSRSCAVAHNNSVIITRHIEVTTITLILSVVIVRIEKEP